MIRLSRNLENRLLFLGAIGADATEAVPVPVGGIVDAGFGSTVLLEILDTSSMVGGVRGTAKGGGVFTSGVIEELRLGGTGTSAGLLTD